MMMIFDDADDVLALMLTKTAVFARGSPGHENLVSIMIAAFLLFNS